MQSLTHEQQNQSQYIRTGNESVNDQGHHAALPADVVGITNQRHNKPRGGVCNQFAWYTNTVTASTAFTHKIQHLHIAARQGSGTLAHTPAIQFKDTEDT
jgi:hypothetical protein